nr:hypothetical protein [Tanacetum cinerariifolium]
PPAWAAGRAPAAGPQPTPVGRPERERAAGGGRAAAGGGGRAPLVCLRLPADAGRGGLLRLCGAARRGPDGQLLPVSEQPP